MEKKITLTEEEIADIRHGLIMAIKLLDENSGKGGSDGILAEKLEKILDEKLGG